MKQEQEQYFQVGMNDFIAKPIKLEEIQRVIKKWADPVYLK
jgi:CheY-like chemotaxis protein